MAASQKGGKGCGSKSSKNPGAASRKAKRLRSGYRLLKKKDLNVARSSHGKFLTVALLAVHTLKVSTKPRFRRDRETTKLAR